MKRKVGARLAASAGLALSVDKVMPTVREMCSREMLDESILKYSLALAYTGILSLMVAASFYIAYSAQRVPGVAEYTVPG